jgi:acyl-CoA synthetase (AMP-forming)/AMP-acid ligase II
VSERRTIPGLIRAAVDDAGGKPWLHTPDCRLSYADMQTRVERAAGALRALGVDRGDRVLTTPRNTADYLLSWFALMEVGAIQVPVNPKSSEPEIAGFVQQVDPALVVTDPELAPLVPASARAVDVAALYDA